MIIKSNYIDVKKETSSSVASRHDVILKNDCVGGYKSLKKRAFTILPLL